MFNKEYIIDGKVFNTKDGKKVFGYLTGEVHTNAYCTKDKRWIGIRDNSKHEILSEREIKRILLHLDYVKIYRKFFGELENI